MDGSSFGRAVGNAVLFLLLLGVFFGGCCGGATVYLWQKYSVNVEINDKNKSTN